MILENWLKIAVCQLSKILTKFLSKTLSQTMSTSTSLSVNSVEGKQSPVEDPEFTEGSLSKDGIEGSLPKGA